jgi:signal transduction histidine kinase
MRVSTKLNRAQFAATFTQAVSVARTFAQTVLDQIRPRLRNKLIIPYFLLIIIVAAIGTYVTTRLVASSVQERFNNQLSAAGDVAEDSIVRKENEHLNNLRLMAFTTGVPEALVQRDVMALRDLLLPVAINNDIEVVSAIDTTGETLLTLALNRAEDHYVLDEGAALADFEPVRRVLQGEVDVRGDKYIGFLQTEQGPYVFTTAPVRDTQQKLVGVLMIGTRVETLLIELKTQSLADIIMLDAGGHLVAATLPEPEQGYGVLELSPEAAQQVDGSVPREVALYGRPYGLVYSRLEVRKQAIGIIGIVLQRDYVVATGATNRNTIIAFFLVLTLLVGILGLVLARMITRPILRLREVSQAVAAGDLEQQTGLKQADEIGDLASAFDAMTLRLRERTTEALRLYDETRRRNTELAEAYDQLRRTQQQLVQSEKMSAIGQLTAGIVHDVKNPLAVIKGLAELMEDDPALDEMNRKNLGQIGEHVNRANRIVTDLMKFARQSNLEMLPGDMRTTVETVVRLNNYLAKQNRVRVVTDLPLQPVITTYDPQLIEQVLVNLVQNAIQAMPNGGTLRLNISQSAHTVAIAVQDTGTGIAPEHLGKIFDPFFTTKPTGEGTGLGLAVSYGIVANHSGKIEVDSTVGKGTTFTVMLPVDPPAPHQETNYERELARLASR